MAKATAAAPLSTAPARACGPRMPPTNSMRLSVRGSPIPSSGARTWSWSSETSSRSAAGGVVRGRRRGAACATAVEIHRDLARARRARRARGRPRRAPARPSRNAAGDCPARSLTTRWYGSTCIWSCGKATARKKSASDRPARVRTRPRRSRRGSGAPAWRSRPGGGRRRCTGAATRANAVDERVDVGLVDAPDVWRDAVGGREVEQRLGRRGAGDDGVRSSGRRRVRQEAPARSAPAERGCGGCGRLPCPCASARACGSRLARTRPPRSSRRPRSARGPPSAAGRRTGSASPPPPAARRRAAGRSWRPPPHRPRRRRDPCPPAARSPAATPGGSSAGCPSARSRASAVFTTS